MASFVGECARSGRWARGLLAVQSHLSCADKLLLGTCAKLAATTARHHWQSALVLLHHCAAAPAVLLGETLDIVSRQPSLPTAEYVRVVQHILTAQHVSNADSNRATQDIFLRATKWVDLPVAEAFLQALPSPSTACKERMARLRSLSLQAAEEVAMHFPSGGPSLPSRSVRPLRDSSRRKLSPQEERVRQRFLRLRAQQLQQSRESIEQAEAVAAFEPLPMWWTVATLLRLAARNRPTPKTGSSSHLSPSWRVALAVLGHQPFLSGLILPYIRCVGLHAPHAWGIALQHLTETASAEQRSSHRLALLWLSSRGNCVAAAAALDGSEGVWGEELLSRGALPPKDFYAIFPAVTTRPPHRLPDASLQSVSAALASGVRLDAIQLSPVAKALAASGWWREALELFYRFPNAEFQRQAVRAYTCASGGEVAEHPAVTRVGNSKIVTVPSLDHFIALLTQREGRRLPPPSTYCMVALVSAAGGWSEALAVLRSCIRAGGQCNPHVLSTAMNHRPPRAEIETLVRSYPAACNNGVRQRLSSEFRIRCAPPCNEVGE